MSGGITVEALKKEPFSLGRGSVFPDCFTVCLGFCFGFRWEIEVQLVDLRGLVPYSGFLGSTLRLYSGFQGDRNTTTNTGIWD
eukprot:6765812-Pyramimonas_sp.AAC.1